MYYAQARYYMPEIGRFISEDPWQGTIAEPTTMNPYPYVQNNPIKYVDPLGLSPSIPIIMADGGGWNGCSIEAINNLEPEIIEFEIIALVENESL